MSDLNPDVLRRAAVRHSTRRLGCDLGAEDLRAVGRVVARGLSGAGGEDRRAAPGKRPPARAERYALHASLTPAAV